MIEAIEDSFLSVLEPIEGVNERSVVATAPQNYVSTICSCQHVHKKEQKSKKDFITTLVLHILLGYFGAHHFYVGNYIKGILTVLSKVFLGFIFFGLFPKLLWIYGLVHIVKGSFTDGKGQPVKP